MSEKYRIAVIGCGLAGLTAARLLMEQGHDVVCFDKARGVGGRMSVRRQDAFEFDHGAQYFTARDPAFVREVQSWIDAKVVAEWTGRIVSLNQGRIESRSPQKRFVAVPGMNELAKYLSKPLRVELSTRIVRLARQAGEWELVGENDAALGDFDRLILSVPAPQVRELLAAYPAVLGRIEAARMEPCWAALAGFAGPLPIDFDGAFVSDSPLGWIARNNSKPGRSSAQAWVLHATPDWSRQHLEDSAQSVAAVLQREFNRLSQTSVAPVFLTAHRWRYARADPALDAGTVCDASLGIALCGDWCAGNRVEGAYLSGIAATKALLDSSDR